MITINQKQYKIAYLYLILIKLIKSTLYFIKPIKTNKPMTPKEKAQELIDKFHVKVHDREGTSAMNEFEAKQCVLIAVDEIIDAVKDLEKWSYIYWQEVKQEILIPITKVNGIKVDDENISVTTSDVWSPKTN